MNSLVSIIIPTFNRDSLLGFTLDSILQQTYTNWECLLIDDGSTDGTLDIINFYLKKDSRFSFYQRPEKRLKGANSCRNIGLENAAGEYIVFFDSDDLMTEDHLEVKVTAIVKNNLDYVITKTKYLNDHTKNLDNYYRFEQYPITPYNYINQNINWLTVDVCIKTSLAKTIKFNENLHSSQEYNYFSKLVLNSVNAIFINKEVTLVRKHDHSIRGQIKSNSEYAYGFFKAYWFTYLDIKKLASTKIKLALLKKCIAHIYGQMGKLKFSKAKFCLEVFKVMGFRSGIYCVSMIISLNFFGKGYYFRSKLIG